jgi:hypothetical protein
LFWSRYRDGEHHVRAWKLFGPGLKTNIQITRSGNFGCECSWTENGVECRVRLPAFLESKSADDPELQDREKLPKPKRDPLWDWTDG